MDSAGSHLDGGRMTKEIQTINAHVGPCYCVRFSPDGSVLASAGLDCKVRIWNGGGGQLLHTLEGHEQSAVAIGFFPDGRKLVSTDMYSIWIWDWQNAEPLRKIKAHHSWVYCATIASQQDFIFSVGNDGRIKKWKASTGENLFESK